VKDDMKKILYGFLVGFLFVLFAGCSHIESEEDSNIATIANVVAIPIVETNTDNKLSESDTIIESNSFTESGTLAESDTIPEYDPAAEIAGYWELTKVDNDTDSQSGPFGFIIGSDMSMMSMQIMEEGSGLIPAGSTHPMALSVQSAIQNTDDKGMDSTFIIKQDDVLCYLTSEENSQYYSVKLSDGFLLLQNCDDEDGLPIYYFERVIP
jgi:hypothetical protein